MKRQWIFRLDVLFLGIVCTLLFADSVMAAVNSTTETAGGMDTVYVVGNPDCYPAEYYNPSTSSYEGILPELLNRISEKTGLNFTYICAGKKDRRLNLAKNGQAELVSGVITEDLLLKLTSVTPEDVIFTVPGESGDIQVSFAYTAIADETLISTMENALKEISEQEISSIVFRFMAEHPQKSYPTWLLPVLLGVIVIMFIMVLILFVKFRKFKKKDDRSVWIDEATGIGNKAYFVRRFETDISDQYRELYCTAYIGFDLTEANRYYGIPEAEEQLRFAANELSLSTRDNEVFARVSGGGFAVLRPTSGEAEAREWVEALLSRLNRYTEKYGKDYRPTFTAGIYMLRPTDRNCNTALFNAKLGYELAVRTGVSCEFSHAEQLKREREKFHLRKQTMEAIKNHQFKMYMQFIVRTDGSIFGAEALSRWEHPQRGLLHPGSYIELLETEKTVTELDFYIFEEACKQLEYWEKQGRRLILCCNFARITLYQEDFVSRLEQIATQYVFDHSQLVIEITENIMKHDEKMVFENVSRSKSMGFRIALDDIGSSYTSFSNLRDYPIDIVKIDHSILNAAIDSKGVTLLKSMIDLFHSLEFGVLCEGVETIEQVELLRRISCDYMQGYYFYRVLPAQETKPVLNMNQNGI